MDEGFEKRSFWSSRKIIFISVLVFGMVLGVIVGHFMVEPFIQSNTSKSYDACAEKVTLLENQVDSCYWCLEKNNIDRSGCS